MGPVRGSSHPESPGPTGPLGLLKPVETTRLLGHKEFHHVQDPYVPLGTLVTLGERIHCDYSFILVILTKATFSNR